MDACWRFQPLRFHSKDSINYWKWQTSQQNSKETVSDLLTWSDDDAWRRLPAGDVSRCVGIGWDVKMEV